MREQNSRETILKCALKLFSNKGYDAVSVNEIASAAQITKPTLCYFFNSKEGLFEELLKDNFNRLDNLLKPACQYIPDHKHYYEDVYPVLLGIVDTFFSYAEENSVFYLMMMSLAFSPPSSRPAAIAEKYQKEQYLLLEKTFLDISQIHTNLKGRERIYSWRFLAIINAQIAFWNRGYSSLDDSVKKSIVTHFMHGIFS